MNSELRTPGEWWYVTGTNSTAENVEMAFCHLGDGVVVQFARFIAGELRYAALNVQYNSQSRDGRRVTIGGFALRCDLTTAVRLEDVGMAREILRLFDYYSKIDLDEERFDATDVERARVARSFTRRFPMEYNRLRALLFAHEIAG